MCSKQVKPRCDPQVHRWTAVYVQWCHWTVLIFSGSKEIRLHVYLARGLVVVASSRLTDQAYQPTWALVGVRLRCRKLQATRKFYKQDNGGWGKELVLTRPWHSRIYFPLSSRGTATHACAKKILKI